MATLVLSSIGTAIGGPLGGLAGGLIGRSVDTSILGASPRLIGPRLQELAVQTSSYGTAIPRIYGRMRVAGTVIWATDLIEKKERSGGGKGRAKTENYSYSANFAVVLSSRAVRRVGRIWADGRLLRGAQGDFKVNCQFRFYSGEEYHQQDPLIAAHEGLDRCPNYSGFSYAVFEDIDLTEFGNHIPSLTFEVIADEEGVSPFTIIEDLSEHGIKREVCSCHVPNMLGYAATYGDQYDIISEIGAFYPLLICGDEAGLTVRLKYEPMLEDIDFETSAVSINLSDILIASNEQNVSAPALNSIAVDSVPSSLSIRYYAPSRDYQSSMQTAFRPSNNNLHEQVEFPAALTSGAAHQLVSNNLWVRDYRRYIAQFSLDIARFESVNVGDLVQVKENEVSVDLMFNHSAFHHLSEKIWQVTGIEIAANMAHVRCELAKSIPVIGQDDIDNGLGDDGRGLPQPDILPSKSALILFEASTEWGSLDAPAAKPKVYAAATALSDGWRGVEVLQRINENGNHSYQPIATINRPAFAGSVVTPPEISPPYLFDEKSTIIIDIWGPRASTVELKNLSHLELVTGANIAQVGDEIIQFRNVEWLSDTRIKLSSFHRGLSGTEKFIENHRPGETFLLIEYDRMHDVTPAMIGKNNVLTFAATGPGDNEPVEGTLGDFGCRSLPLSPVHVKVQFRNDDLHVNWVRRSRSYPYWQDYFETPLGEAQEYFEIIVRSSVDNEIGRFYSSDQSKIFTSALWKQWQAISPDHIFIQLAQVGDHGVSSYAKVNVDWPVD